MTHWILRLILIAIQIAQQISGIPQAALSHFDTAAKASDYFDYSLCKPPTDDVTSGAGWKCYEPTNCDGAPGNLVDVTDVTGTCHAFLAVQYLKSANNGIYLRIVLQIQQSQYHKVTIGSGVKFIYNDQEIFSCKFDSENVEIYKQNVANYFEVERSYSFAKFDNNKFMCEAKLKVRADYDSPASHAPVGIIYAESDGDKTSSKEKAKFWADLIVLSTCMLGDVLYHAAEIEEKVESKHVNMDRNGFTCPAGYVMRMADQGGSSSSPSFTAVTSFYCASRSSSRFDFTTPGQNAKIKTKAVFMHCARKLCKQCEKPTCPPAANGKCPTVNIVKPDDFESCAKLTCASSTTLKVGDKIHKGEPVCENKKWMFDGNEVMNAECAAALDCEASSKAVTVAKPEDMNMDEAEVTCTKERNMTYTADDQTIVLSKVSCNKLEGKWYEERVDPPGSELYSDENVLRCVGTDGAAAPSKGGLPLMVIGASLAAVALIIVVVIIIICCCKKRRAARESAQKHKLATKSSKSKENRSKESKSGLSKSNMASSSGAPGVSSDHSVTQKNSKKDREMKSLGIDKSEGAKTAVSIDGTNPKTAAEIKDEERSNPTERSAIPKTEDLNKDINGKKKTAAMLESSKMEDNEEPAQEAVERVQKAMGRKGATRTRNLDGTQAGTTMGPDGTQGPETMDPDGTQAMTAAQQKRRATRKGTFMQTGVADPSRGPDGTQQPSENGPDETQNPTGATAETQAATAAGRRTRERTRGTQQTTGGRRTQGTQNGGDDDDEAEQPLWEPHTAVEKTDEGAGNTGIPRDPTRVRTTQDQTRTKMHTGVHEEESAAIDPPIDDMHTGKEKEKDDDDDSSRMNTAMAKDRKTVDKHTAVEKEDGESKKPKSKKGARQLKPREMELNEKEKKIKAGAKRNRNDYPTMRDIESDWDSDKDKKDGQPRKKKTLEEKKKKKSKQEKEKEKKDSKRKDKEKKESKKKEKEKDRKKSKTKEGEVREVTAIDDGPSGVTGQNYYTARESTARDGTQNLTPHDPTQAATAATQRTRNKTATIMTTAFDPTETHAAPTIADPTQAATAQDPTQGATTMDRTQGGGTRTTQGGRTTTMLDRTTQGGLTTVGADGTQGMTTVADFTQAHTTGADPTQAGTTIFDRTTQGQTTVGDATTQGETRTRVFTGRTRGPSRTQTQTRTRTRADFTQGATTAADFTQGGATTIADPTQAHNTSADPTQAATTIGGDPTQAQTRVSMEESQETQHQTGTINDPTQLHSAETQEGRTKKSRTKAAFTARTGTRPGTTQSRTKADFTQGATTLADPTQAPTPTAQDPTQGVTTAGDGTQLATRTKTRTRQQGVTQTATAGDRTQTQTRKDPTQTETRGEETQQGQTEVPGTDGTQIPSKTKTRKTTGKDFTQTATAGDPTQTQTRAGGTQTQTAVDPTRTMTAVDRTRTETKERTGRTRTKGPTQTQTALDPTGTMTAVDRTGLTTAKDRTQTETRAGGTQTQTAVDPTRTQTAVDPTHTMTAVDPTNTMTAVDPTHMTTGKDRTQTQTAVDPTRTMTAVDPTHTMTAVDPTGTQTAVDRTRSATKMASRTQTQTAAEQTQTKMERTKTKTARDKTQTQTNADETQAAGATTLGAAETQAMSKPTTAKDRTQTATRDKTKEGRTQTSANKTQTTAKDQQTQMTGHETTQGPTTKDPTQTHNDQ